MDNFRIDVTSEGKQNLALAMELAFGRHRSVTHYAVRTEPARLVFYWTDIDYVGDVRALPFKLDSEGAVDFALRWLAEVDYGDEPDHGDNGRRWRLYNESWGHVDGHWQAFVAIKPAWAMYGKCCDAYYGL